MINNKIKRYARYLLHSISKHRIRYEWFYLLDKNSLSFNYNFYDTNTVFKVSFLMDNNKKDILSNIKFELSFTDNDDIFVVDVGDYQLGHDYVNHFKKDVPFVINLIKEVIS